MMQIVQELCKRPNLNRTGFDMPTIYIPNPNKPVRCVNQIDDVCKDIEKTINQTIQVLFWKKDDFLLFLKCRMILRNIFK